MQKKPKVLWLNNIIMPEAAEAFGFAPGFVGGWLVGLFHAVKNMRAVDLTVVFPMYGKQGTQKRKIDGVTFYGVGVTTVYDIYDENTEHAFKAIIEQEQPDLVHVFGTEFPHSLAMVYAFNQRQRTVVSIQGLPSIYPIHYLEGIPIAVARGRTLREFLSGRGLDYERNKFGKRGVLETACIRMVGHIIGRTDWDKACTSQVNPKANYHHCYESLRDSFYEASWDIKKIERHSIFMSQGSYPIKGLHIALQALAILRSEFPDLKLYIGGVPPINPYKKGIRRLLASRSYPRFIENLIKLNDLQEKVIFLGNLDEAEMRERFLKTNVFVSASVIENSPNSVGEANLLGVPCVASHVGGVAELMEHYKEGYVYQPTAPYMLAYYIKKLFNDDENCIAFSKTSQKHAKEVYNRDANGKQMIQIYQEILKEALT